MLEEDSIPWAEERKTYLDQSAALSRVVREPPSALVAMARALPRFGEGRLLAVLATMNESGQILRNALGTPVATKSTKPDGQVVCEADLLATVPFQRDVIAHPLFVGFGFSVEEKTELGDHKNNLKNYAQGMTQDAMDGSGHICEPGGNLEQVGVMASYLEQGESRLAIVYCPFSGRLFFGNGEESHDSQQGRIQLPRQFDPNRCEFLVNRAGSAHQTASVDRFMATIKSAKIVRAGSVFPLIAWANGDAVAVHEDYKKENDAKRGPWDRAVEDCFARGLGIETRRLSDLEPHGLYAAHVPHLLARPEAMEWIATTSASCV